MFQVLDSREVIFSSSITGEGEPHLEARDGIIDQSLVTPQGGYLIVATANWDMLCKYNRCNQTATHEYAAKTGSL